MHARLLSCVAPVALLDFLYVFTSNLTHDGSANSRYIQKNAKVSHKNVIANIMQAYTSDATYKNPEPELCLGVLPTSHNLGLVGVSMLSIYRGDGVVVLPRFDLEETLKTIHDYRIGRLWMVRTIVHLTWFLLANWRLIRFLL